MLGSVTPSSFTRRSMVWRACTTDSARSCTTTFGFIVNTYAPVPADARSKFACTSLAACRNAASCGVGTPSIRKCVGSGDVRFVKVTFALVSSSRSRSISGVGFELQRIVGLHAEHELHAAVEVETELELLVHQPGGRVDAVARGDNRIHPDAREHHEHDRRS